MLRMDILTVMCQQALAVCKFCGTVLKFAFEWLYVEVTSIVNCQLSFRTELFGTECASEIHLCCVYGQVDFEISSRLIVFITELALVNRIFATIATLVIRQ